MGWILRQTKASKQISAQKNTFALVSRMGTTEDAVEGPVAKNNNRPPYNNKKEHVQRFKGEPRLPFMLSGV